MPKRTAPDYNIQRSQRCQRYRRQCLWRAGQRRVSLSSSKDIPDPQRHHLVLQGSHQPQGAAWASRRCWRLSSALCSTGHITALATEGMGGGNASQPPQGQDCRFESLMNGTYTGAGPGAMLIPNQRVGWALPESQLSCSAPPVLSLLLGKQPSPAGCGSVISACH